MSKSEISNYMKNEKNTKVNRFRHLNPLAEKGQIVFAGSSLMEQFPIHELLQNNHEFSKVIYNRGIGGFTIPEMLETMEEQIFELEPSVIFINIGTNDISEPDCTIDSLINNYEKVLQQIKERLPKTKVYMMAYYPVNDVDIEPAWPGADVMIAARKEKLPAANEAIKKLAEKMGYEYIDVNHGLTDERGLLKKEYTIDGIHMYANGYQVVYENLKKYL